MTLLRYGALSIFLLLCVFEISAQERIDPKITSEVSLGGSVSCILVYEPLLLSGSIPSNLSKKEKGRLAYHLLNEHLKGKAASTVSILRSKGIPYRVNLLSSTISVRNMNEEVVQALSNIPEIKRILYNYNYNNLGDRVPYDELELRNTFTWGLLKTETNKLHELGITGEGAVVGGNDTGFDWTHSAIQAKYRGWNNGVPDHSYNWHDAIHEISPLSDTTQNPCGLNIKEPCDDNGHGTHTMGTMVGVKGDTLTIGMAPGARWIAVRNMERGNGNLQGYIEALDWFMAPTDINDENPDPDKAPDVINNSWYCSESEGCNSTNWEVMRISVSNLKAAGIVVVASAGNAGPNCETIAFVPGMLDDAFSIGAADSEDTIAGFSSRGVVSADGSFRLKPDVSAPGVSVHSSLPNENYANFSGTSMAGPHVAGLVALMIGANPDLAGQVDTIQEIIKRTAEHLTSDQDCSGISGLEIPNPIYGFGRINALRAVIEGQKFTLKENKITAGQINFKTYPNPAHHEVMISTPENEIVNNIILMDIQGRVLRTVEVDKTINHYRLTLTGIGQGTYLIRLISDKRSGIQKLFIEN